MSYVFNFGKCPFCGREFLIERHLMEADHTIITDISCKDCLKKEGINSKFKQQHPEESEKIEKWLKEI